MIEEAKTLEEETLKVKTKLSKYLYCSKIHRWTNNISFFNADTEISYRKGNYCFYKSNDL